MHPWWQWRSGHFDIQLIILAVFAGGIFLRSAFRGDEIHWFLAIAAIMCFGFDFRSVASGRANSCSGLSVVRLPAARSLSARPMRIARISG
jgi:hypothetical protein